MDKMLDCKIVQDLLPNYIEHLTSEDTNQYIDRHLEECKSCKDTLEDMKTELKNIDQKTNQTQVDFLKKYHQKLKWLKIFLFSIVLFILIFFSANLGRKMIILAHLKNQNNEQYGDFNNFYFINYSYYEDMLNIYEYYKKDNHSKIVNSLINENGKFQTIYYTDGTKQNRYQIGPDFKEAWLNEDSIITTRNMKLTFFDESTDLKGLLKCAFQYRITTDNCNNKECYRIEKSAYNSIEYIDKETGLLLRAISNPAKNTAGQILDYKYEFNKVTDEDFIEPDLSEYEIVKE